MTFTAQYPDRLKTLKGLVTLPLATLSMVRPGVVVYVRRVSPRRGERFYAGQLYDRRGERVRVLVSRNGRKPWFPLADVFVVIAS